MWHYVITQDGNAVCLLCSRCLLLCRPWRQGTRTGCSGLT
jgi:hypothetical protein